MHCKLCEHPVAWFGEGTVLHEHRAIFYRCVGCGSVQVNNPSWLAQAYSAPITVTDIGYASRNVYDSKLVKLLVAVLFNRRAQFVDYGGGYGLFVRLMRDAGLDFYRYDKYCTNLFAVGFDAEREKKYELVTAFEVFEHLESPKQSLSEMLGFADSVFFSTFVLPDPAPPLEEWWYYGLHHGQHIMFYSIAGLQALARDAGCRLLTNGRDFHLLTRRRIPQIPLSILTARLTVSLCAPLLRFGSLLKTDYARLRQEAESLSPSLSEADRPPASCVQNNTTTTSNSEG
jgi:hypothetical protein